MLSPEEITSYVPPYILHDIRENREGIQKLKNVLRAADVEIEDQEDDFNEVQRLLSRTRKYLVLLADYRRLCGLEDNQWQEAKAGFELIRRESPSFPDKLHLLEPNNEILFLAIL